MNTSTVTVKRLMANPEAHIGKRMDPNVWIIPAGYHLCAKTWKLQREDDLLISFNHHVFDRAFLRKHNIMVEDAEWLSEEGYFEILDVLDSLGLKNAYLEADWNASFRGVINPPVKS